jgi:non-specific serine/threonine protein kinase/serine/threonine-protein kinase
MNEQPTKDELPAMTPERWQQIKPLFEQALECDASQREQFLAQACAGDAELRTQLEALLNSHEEASTFIEKPAIAKAAQLFEAEDALIGQQVGPYKILREIGHGGMGRVYLGVRVDEEYKKRVALKVIKHGMDSKDIVRRFRHERQILASLDHPNIGKLLDGGTTTDGLPYFAMEYVEGQPITDYCDSHKLSTIERLNLFRQVCAAVQFAHQNLVVHRDLKPSNILVTEDGTPKLLDFGIAKFLNPELSGQTIDPTATALRLMTPEYASPEQVRGDTITTASDVYSLGVVLYELLTGHRPYHVKSRAPHDILRIVCEEEPERPSTAVNRIETIPNADGSTRAITPETVSRARESEPEKLRRRLRGDLDNIVLMAMRKEPQRRYTTVNQLSEDIRRHLEGLPVVARHDTLTYRIEKFVQRNRVAVIAAAVVVMILLVGLVSILWQARVAQNERAKAEQRFNEVRKLANTLLFDVHDAIEKLPGTTKTRELIIKQALDYLDSLARASINDVSLQLELATAYRKIASVQGNPNTQNLGGTASALENYRKALDISLKAYAAAPQDMAVRRDLAASYKGYADLLAITRKLAEAVENYGKAAEIYEELLARQPNNIGLGVDLMRAYLKLGDTSGLWIFPNLGDRAKAQSYYDKMLELGRKLAERAPHDAGVQQFIYLGYERIGDLQNEAQATDAALASYQQSEQITRQLLARDQMNLYYPRHIAVLYQKMFDLLLYRKKDIPAAREKARQAFAFLRPLAEKDLADVEMQGALAISYDRLGDIEAYTGNLSGAIEPHRKYYEICARLHTDDPINQRVTGWFLDAAEQLVKELYQAGQVQEGSPIAARLLHLYKTQADSPTATATDLNAYAWALLTTPAQQLRQPPSALSYAERATELSGGKDAGILDTLAKAYFLTANPVQAVATQEKALALLPPDAPDRKSFEATLAEYKTALQGSRK